MPIRRALLVCQDNLLRNCPEITTDFIGTGSTITPGGATSAQSFTSLTGKMMTALTRLAAAKYDLVILPAVNLTWSHDQSRFKKNVRGLTRWILALQEKINLLRLLGKKPLIAVLDRYDSFDIYPEMANAVGADIYFKANCPSGGLPAYPFKVRYLPYWIFEENYPDMSVEKKVDVFYSAAMNSDSRRLALKELAALEKQGVTVDHPEKRLPFPEFVARMAQAVLTLSPSGHGYHGFRHYEAMLMKSVPVLNMGEHRLETDLIDGKNCLLYDSVREGGLARCLTQALKDRLRLIQWGQDLRSFAMDRHSTAAVARYLVAEMEGGKSALPQQK